MFSNNFKELQTAKIFIMMNYRQITVFSFILIFILSFSQCVQNKPDDSPAIIGPYLQNMSEGEVTICWSTLEGTTQIMDGDSIVQNVNQYSYNKSIITRLKPNTTYSHEMFNLFVFNRFRLYCVCIIQGSPPTCCYYVMCPTMFSMMVIMVVAI